MFLTRFQQRVVMTLSLVYALGLTAWLMLLEPRTLTALYAPTAFVFILVLTVAVNAVFLGLANRMFEARPDS